MASVGALNTSEILLNVCGFKESLSVASTDKVEKKARKERDQLKVHTLLAKIGVFLVVFWQWMVFL